MKAQSLTLAENSVSFPRSDKFTLFIFEKMTKCSFPNNFSVNVLSSRMVFHEKTASSTYR